MTPFTTTASYVEEILEVALDTFWAPLANNSNMAPTACLWLSPMLAASSAAYAHNWAAPLPTTVAAMRSPAPVALVSREARLHSVARRAALAGRSSEAQQAYNLAIELWGSGRSFLLSALLQSRLGQ